MLNNFFIFIVALFLVIRGATMATKHSAHLARRFGLSEYTVGFIIVAIISILPEAFISINAALEGVPAFGLGMLFGSNIADLTLIFAIIIFVTGRSLKIESKILKNRALFPFLLLLPIILGLDGHFSRLEGAALIVAGAVFYYLALRDGRKEHTLPSTSRDGYRSIFMLVLSIVILVAGAHFTVSSATSLANYFNISSILIGMFVVALGTTMPELFFSLKSAEKHDDSLAVGDILGTVLADATVMIGLLAVITPFSFPIKIIYITGTFMVLASIVLFAFMRSGRVLSKREGHFLLLFWIIFVVVELFANF